MIRKLMIRLKRSPIDRLRINLKTCKFRTKFYVLDFGGTGGFGTAAEWLGIRVEFRGIPV